MLLFVKQIPCLSCLLQKWDVVNEAGHCRRKEEVLMVSGAQPMPHVPDAAHRAVIMSGGF